MTSLRRLFGAATDRRVSAQRIPNIFRKLCACQRNFIPPAHGAVQCEGEWQAGLLVCRRGRAAHSIHGAAAHFLLQADCSSVLKQILMVNWAVQIEPAIRCRSWRWCRIGCLGHTRLCGSYLWLEQGWSRHSLVDVVHRLLLSFREDWASSDLVDGLQAAFIAFVVAAVVWGTSGDPGVNQRASHPSPHDCSDCL